MADHRAAPEAAGVEVRIVRLGADGGGVEQDFRAHQHHRAGGFGIPLVPPHPDAHRAVAGLPSLAAGLAGAEIEFLRIPRTVGDVAPSLHAPPPAPPPAPAPPAPPNL